MYIQESIVPRVLIKSDMSMSFKCLSFEYTLISVTGNGHKNRVSETHGPSQIRTDLTDLANTYRLIMINHDFQIPIERGKKGLAMYFTFLVTLLRV